jgi:LmbE family N-acetylglucosaminyl deacetylase
MNSLTPSVNLDRLFTVDAHPDDREMKFAGLIAKAQRTISLTATRGEASTVNLARGSLCRFSDYSTCRSSDSR